MLVLDTVPFLASADILAFIWIKQLRDVQEMGDGKCWGMTWSKVPKYWNQTNATAEDPASVQGYILPDELTVTEKS